MIQVTAAARQKASSLWRDRAALTALAAILLAWVGLFWGTWAHWGDVVIDTGREVYVPGLLAEGKTLYKDVWYLYGPLAPYFNSLLFQFFGTRLETTYWAGSLSALASAILLLQAGFRAGYLPAGLTGGLLILVQGFVPSLFSFPLPYSFAAVYGCLVSCAFLWVAQNAAEETGSAWFFVASWLATIGLLLKMEYGTALYGGAFMLVAVRFIRDRRLRRLAHDVALLVPGFVVVLVVVRWMIQLRGLDFLLQQNLMSWPSSYFMRTYGDTWLRLTMSGGEGIDVIYLLLFMLAFGVFWFSIRRIRIAARENNARSLLLPIVTASACVFLVWNAGVVSVGKIPIWFVFPKFAPLVVAAGVCCCLYSWFKVRRQVTLQAALAGTFSFLLCLRLLNGTRPFYYSVYYDGPLIVCLIPMIAWVITPQGANWKVDFRQSQTFLGALLIFLVISTLAPMYSWNRTAELIQTPRGNIFVPPEQAKGFREALDFIARQSRVGQSVMVVPEDTMLYFLSGTTAPARVFSMVPGTLAPGEMTDEFLDEVKRAAVSDIIWSNRTFTEYGAANFGVDFDQPVGDYIHENFEVAGRLPAVVADGEWQATIWHRKRGSE
jgi:hypothetical protein